MSAVYIPSKARTDYLPKTIPRWLESLPDAVPVYVVVDKPDYPEYKAAIKAGGWSDRVTPLNNGGDGKGIGYTRNIAVNHAYRAGMKSIILADDDLRPVPGQSVNMLFRQAARKGRLGIGATWSYQGLLSGGVTEDRANGLILCPSGWGHNFFALNVENAILCGNFNRKLYCAFEDDELQRQGLSRGMPWLVHCDVKYQNLGKRFTAGGVSAQFDESLASRMKGIAECQAIVAKIWPEYVAAPPKRPRTAWASMHDRYLPGWRSKSAIHGGHL